MCQQDDEARLSGMSSEELEREADRLLAGTLKSRKRNKSRTDEYPILSGRQQERREDKEVPFSSMAPGKLRELGVK